MWVRQGLENYADGLDSILPQLEAKADAKVADLEAPLPDDAGSREKAEREEQLMIAKFGSHVHTTELSNLMMHAEVWVNVSRGSTLFANVLPPRQRSQPY